MSLADGLLSRRFREALCRPERGASAGSELTVRQRCGFVEMFLCATALSFDLKREKLRDEGFVILEAIDLQCPGSTKCGSDEMYGQWYCSFQMVFS